MLDGFVALYLENPLAQSFGFLGMILVLSAFLQKEDNKTIQILALANIFWIGHFFLLAAYPALASSIIGMVRMFLSLKYKKNKRVFYGILAVVILMGVITYEDHISLLPTLAGCLSAY
jgi:tetrahydromethanopterin S-methyltransferase subunit D